MTITNVLTVDLEDWFHASNLSSHVPRSAWASALTRIEDTTTRLLNLFDQQHVHATFFVPAGLPIIAQMWSSRSPVVVTRSPAMDTATSESMA